MKTAAIGRAHRFRALTALFVLCWVPGEEWPIFNVGVTGLPVVERSVPWGEAKRLH
jgi:hypothetical protein